MKGAPYPGPRPFDANESGVFFGRDREARDLRDLILSYSVVVLYAQSGAGKSSLVNAGLRPLLPGAGFAAAAVLAARMGGGATAPEAIDNIYAYNASATAFNRRPAAAHALTEFIEALRSVAASQPSLLILDQAEEIFTDYPARWKDRTPFLRELGRALQIRPDLHVLIALREEYVAELDSYADLMPHGFSIRFRLERLRAAGRPLVLSTHEGEQRPPALDAIVRPAAKWGVEFELGLAERIVRDLATIRVETTDGITQVSGEFVEPVHLQVVCRRLWERVVGKTRITAEDVKTFGDVDQALISSYERALRAAMTTGVAERRLRSWVGAKLITSTGTRSIVHREKDKTAGLPTAAVEAFREHRLVHVQRRANAVWYELTHDRFVSAIQRSNLLFTARSQGRAARAVVTALALALVLGWALLIEPAGATWHSERAAAASARAPLSDIVRAVERRASTLNAFAVAKEEQGSLRSFTRRTAREGKGSPVPVQRDALDKKRLMSRYSALVRERAWAEAQMSPPHSRVRLEIAALTWCAALVLLLAVMKASRLELLQMSMQAVHGARLPLRTTPILVGWRPLPAVRHLDDDVSDGTGWQLHQLHPPLSTVLLAGGLFLILLRVTWLLTPALFERSSWLPFGVGVVLAVLSLSSFQWMRQATPVSRERPLNDVGQGRRNAVAGIGAVSIAATWVLMASGVPHLSDSGALVVFATIGVLAALGLGFVVSLRGQDAGGPLETNRRRRRFLLVAACAPLALVGAAPIAIRRLHLLNGGSVSLVQPRFVRREPRHEYQTSLSHGFVVNRRSDVAHYVQEGGALKCASPINEQNFAAIDAADLRASSGTAASGPRLTLGRWSVSLEMYTINTVEAGAAQKAIDLLTRELKVRFGTIRAVFTARAGDTQGERFDQVRAEQLAMPLLRTCDLYAALSVSIDDGRSLLEFVRLLDGEPRLLRAIERLERRVENWRDRDSKWWKVRAGRPLRWSSSA